MLRHLWIACLILAAMPVVGYGQLELFDVNDVSILWPVPKNQADVDSLISATDLLADNTTTIWPEPAFKKLLAEALKVGVPGFPAKIDFKDKAAFETLKTWKVAGIRIDPCAPGGDPKVVQAAPFGTAAQIRLIMQPVTSNAGKVEVHDVTTHLVFNYTTAPDPMTKKTSPDKITFAAIVNDLAMIKSDLKGKSIPTAGPLNVHPGFKDADFGKAVKAFLAKNLAEPRLRAMAFMGIANGAEPWIFFSMVRTPAGFIVPPNTSADILNFRGGDHVVPRPKAANLDGGKGAATDILFPDPIALAKLKDSVLADGIRPFFEDVPDIIANPGRTHFFNVNCVSCHTESSRRAVLKIDVKNSEFAYKLPKGISAVDPGVLQTSKWNVRNFGWFPDFFSGSVSPSVAARTGNEAAESADFINREYLAQRKN